MLLNKQASRQLVKANAKKAATVVKTSKSTKAGGFGGEREVNLEKWYGPDRALFLPGGLLSPEDVPEYLTGELPGDYGYDPLGLGKDDNVEKYRANELLHARWAMLAVGGCLIPEGLEAAGADIKGGTYFTTPGMLLDGGLLNYFAVPWGIVQNPLPLIAVVVINVGLMTAVEFFRKNGEGPKGFSPGFGFFESEVFEGVDPLYPGGPFDPLNLAADPEVFAELKVKEIKNGRLAMVAMLAFTIQSLVTKEGPYANFIKHVQDPFGYNLLTILQGEDGRTPNL